MAYLRPGFVVRRLVNPLLMTLGVTPTLAVRGRRSGEWRVAPVNVLEHDPINSFHLHANFFHYFPTGTSLTPSEFTDTVSQVQGQRGILEVRFPYTGQYMFHAHTRECAELGWTGVFEVT